MEHKITEGEKYIIRQRGRQQFCLVKRAGLDPWTSAILIYYRLAFCHHASTCLDEAALYDRQIRLWGLEAQHR